MDDVEINGRAGGYARMSGKTWFQNRVSDSCEPFKRRQFRGGLFRYWTSFEVRRSDAGHREAVLSPAWTAKPEDGWDNPRQCFRIIRNEERGGNHLKPMLPQTAFGVPYSKKKSPREKPGAEGWKSPPPLRRKRRTHKATPIRRLHLPGCLNRCRL